MEFNKLLMETQNTEKRKFIFVRDQILTDLSQLEALFKDENLRKQVLVKLEELKRVISSTKLDKEYKDLHLNVMEDMRKDVKILVKNKLGMNKIEKMIRDASVK